MMDVVIDMLNIIDSGSKGWTIFGWTPKNKTIVAIAGKTQNIRLLPIQILMDEKLPRKNDENRYHFGVWTNINNIEMNPMNPPNPTKNNGPVFTNLSISLIQEKNQTELTIDEDVPLSRRTIDNCSISQPGSQSMPNISTCLVRQKDDKMRLAYAL